MGVRITRTERLRAQARGFRKFIEEEKDRLERGVYADTEDHARERIEEYERRLEELEYQLDGDDEKVLDDERHEFEEVNEYTSDEEAQSDGYESAWDGNRERKKEWDAFCEFHGNLGASVECQVEEDLASVGLTKKDLGELAQEYNELVEEANEMFGGWKNESRNVEDGRDDEDEEECDEEDDEDDARVAT